ncbi:MAG: PRC-barrel domain containing protein, partial [Hyphomonas sp.]
YVAMVSGTIAAVMVSSNIGRRSTGYGFVVFSVSSVIWVLYGLQDTELPLIIQNAVLTLINIIGIYRWLILKRPST